MLLKHVNGHRIAAVEAFKELGEEVGTIRQKEEKTIKFNKPKELKIVKMFTSSEMFNDNTTNISNLIHNSDPTDGRPI